MNTEEISMPAKKVAWHKERWPHHDVDFPIRITDSYIVYLDKNGLVDWEMVVEHGNTSFSPEQAALLADVEGDISVAESYPLHGYSQQVKHHFNKLLGEARVHWIESDAATARKLVHAARIYYRERSEEISRYWYLFAGITSASIFFAAAIIGWLCRNIIIPHIGHTGFSILLASCGGAIGAMFSIITRSGELKFKASSGRNLHNIEAISRILLGAISAAIAYLAVKTSLIFGAFSAGTNNMQFLILISLAAGAGERLATSIISNFDKNDDETSKNKDD